MYINGISTINPVPIPLDDLKRMYDVSKSEELIDHTCKYYGIKGVMKLDISVALGMVSVYLEKNNDFLFNILHLTTDDKEYQTILVLCLDIFKTMIQSEDGSDGRYTTIMNIVEKMNFKETSQTRLRINQNFLKGLLDVTRLDSEGYLDSESNYDTNEILLALSCNDSINDSDIFGWLSMYPEVAESRIVGMFDDIRRSKISNLIIYRNFKKSINTMNIMLQYFRMYSDLLERLEETGSKTINVQTRLATLMEKIINQLEITTDGETVQLFLDTKHCIAISTGSETEINNIILFWSIFMKMHEDLLEDEAKILEDLNDPNPSRDQIVVLLDDFNSYIDAGDPKGLFYAIYLTSIGDILDQFLSNTSMVEYSMKTYNKIRETVKYLMDFGILPNTFSRYEDLMETVKIMYPDIEIFKDTADSNVVSTGDTEEILDLISQF